MQEWRQHGEGGVQQLQQQGGLRRRNIKTRKSYRCEIDPKSNSTCSTAYVSFMANV